MARAWAARHAEANPGDALYHFYGREMFDEIMAAPSFAHLDVTPALDDEGRPQFVLMAWNDAGDGKTRSQSTEPTPYDSGVTCPPVCSGEE